jgi:uncharacterized membrane protein YraQ (UPF0718 family)
MGISMAQTTPTANPTTTPTTNPNQDKASTRTDARFWIAFAIIIGLIAILVIVVLQAQYTQASTLAGIFSGWITSIVAFYFYGQTTANAQSQIAQSSQNANNAQKQLEFSNHKITRALDHLEMSAKGHEDLAARLSKTGLKPEIVQQEKSEAYQKTLQEIKDILSQP